MGDDNQPIFNIPKTVLFMALAIIAAHLLRLALPDQWLAWLLPYGLFIPANLTIWLTQPSDMPLAPLLAMLGYMFVHGNWAHLLVNLGMLLAFGSGAARFLSPPRWLLLYVIGGALALLPHYLLDIHATQAVVGASGAISALFGGMVYMFWMIERRTGEKLGARQHALAYVAINLLLIFVPFSSSDGDALYVAWAVHLGGFAIGFIAMPLILSHKHPLSPFYRATDRA